MVDKCIGSRIHIIMKNDKEIVGTLLGFDDFVSILYKMKCKPIKSVTAIASKYNWNDFLHFFSHVEINGNPFDFQQATNI